MAAEDPRSVSRLLGRVIAASLGLLLAAGPVGLCATVTPTPEARMACCTGHDPCPMHNGSSPGATSHHQPTQSQADQCCLASEGKAPHQSMPMSVGILPTPVIDASVLLPLDVPALVRTDAWRMSTPLLVTPVPRHLLLAVFLV
jgi:hypothetical protein